MALGETVDIAALPPFNSELLRAMDVDEQINAVREHAAALAGPGLENLTEAARLRPYGDDRIWSDLTTAAFNASPRTLSSVDVMVTLARAQGDDERQDAAWTMAREQAGTIMLFKPGTDAEVQSLVLLMRGETDHTRLEQVFRMSMGIRSPVNQHRASVAIGHAYASLGYVAPRAVLGNVHPEDLSAMSVTRARHHVSIDPPNSDAARRTMQDAILPAHQTLTRLAIARIEGPESDVWGDIRQNLATPHDLSAQHRHEIVEALLACGDVDAALTLASSLPLTETIRTGRDFRTESMKAIARYQAVDNVEAAQTTLTMIEDDQRAIHGLAIKKIGTTGHDDSGSRLHAEIVIDEVRAERLAVRAHQEPEAVAAELLNLTTEFGVANNSSHTRLRHYAAIHVLPTLVRAGLVAEAAAFANTLHPSTQSEAFTAIGRALVAAKIATSAGGTATAAATVAENT